MFKVSIYLLFISNIYNSRFTQNVCRSDGVSGEVVDEMKLGIFRKIILGKNIMFNIVYQFSIM